MKITTVGIDLAKNVFQVHAVDERGTVVLRKQLRRDQMTAFFANLPPSVIGMEACGSAHHWARTLKSLGHDPRLMSPQFVKPYVKSNKNKRGRPCTDSRLTFDMSGGPKGAKRLWNVRSMEGVR